MPYLSPNQQRQSTEGKILPQEHYISDGIAASEEAALSQGGQCQGVICVLHSHANAQLRVNTWV